MNNKQNDLVKCAIEKIKCDQKCKPNCFTIIGPIGPTGATGTSDISGMFLVDITTINSVLTVRNPAGNAAALTITPLAGGTNPVSAHLVIIQLQ